MAHAKLKITGMQCGGCETIIETAVSQLQGIEKVDADYPHGTVDVSFDADTISLSKIKKTIEQSGYSIAQSASSTKPFWLKFLIALMTVIGLAVVMVAARKVSHQLSLPELDSHLSDGMIFFIGLITGLHCIGMCGAFVLGYTAKDAQQHRSSWPSHLLYGLGKTVSYAMFGALFGLLGSMISITPFMQGVTNIVAGVFLVLFGLNMLDMFAVLKHVRLRQPQQLARFAIERRQRSRSPFFIGFFTGFLIGCGPLQAMYVMAAGSSDPLVGAKIMTLFGLGTLPALFSFGFLSRIFSATATHRFFKLSGLILIVIGAMMLNKGLIRTNSGYDFKSLEQKMKTEWKQVVNLPLQ
ncbi:MAG TPA: heavy metal transport/detoxification protein [Crenotrichaceae bacterium]|nr:heavy metal transport/detoxification protein [Crenotrichaceae bacterium]